MEQDLKCMREEDQMLVVRGERDSFSDLSVAKVIPQDMLNEEVRLQGLLAGSIPEVGLTNTGDESEHSKGQ